MNKILHRFDALPIQNLNRFNNQYGMAFKKPNKAKTFSFIRVLANDSEMDILTFADKKGQSIKKIFILDDIIKERTYIPLKDAIVSIGEGLVATGRKVSTIIKHAGKYIHKEEEIQSVTTKEDGSKIIHISKIIAQPTVIPKYQSETQAMYKFEKGVAPKGYIINGYFRNKNGIDYSFFKPQIGFENFSDESKANFEDDAYLPLHLYSLKQFRQVAPNSIAPGKYRTCDIKWKNFKNLKLLGQFTGKEILLSKSLKDRLDIIVCATHEKEHLYQQDEINLLDCFERLGLDESYKLLDALERGSGKDLEKTFENARIYREEARNYIDGREDVEGYLNQTIEKKAREAEDEEGLKFMVSGISLKKEFPYAPSYMIAADF